MSILPENTKRLHPEGGKVQLQLPFLKRMKEDARIESNKENSPISTISYDKENIEDKKDNPNEKDQTPKKSGFLMKWTTTYFWVRYDSTSNLMFCTWCEEYAEKEKLKANIIDNNFVRGTSNFKNSALSDHVVMKDHQKARELQEKKSDNDNLINKIDPSQLTIKESFKNNRQKLQYEMMLPLFRNIYFTVVESLALLKYESLNDLCELHEVEFNENYRNRISGKEMLSYIAESIRSKLVNELQKTEYFGMSLDSSMDISSIENLTITVRYLNRKNEIVETYLKLLSIKEKNAEYIFKTVIDFLTPQNLLNKIIGISTDGEKAIASLKNGFIGKMTRLKPWILFCHCTAHRLALCAKDLVKEIAYLKEINKLVYQTCKFLNSSAKRIQILRDNELNDLNPQLRLIKPLDVRWLSNLDAIDKIIELYESIINTFTEIISDDNDATAIGLNQSLTNFSTVALLHLFADILDPVKKLMLHFQKRDIDLDSMETDYEICSKDLQDLYEGKIGRRLFDFLEKVEIEPGTNKYSYKNIYLVSPLSFHQQKQICLKRSKEISKILLDKLQKRFKQLPSLLNFKCLNISKVKITTY